MKINIGSYIVLFTMLACQALSAMEEDMHASDSTLRTTAHFHKLASESTVEQGNHKPQAIDTISLPSDVFIHIAQYLSGTNKDFQNFALSCRHIRTILINYKPFFVPEDEELLLEAVKNTSLEELNAFFSKFSRNLNKEKIMDFFKISFQFDDHKVPPNLNESQAQDKLNNLKMCIKMNRILMLANFEPSKEKLVSIKADKLCSLLTDLREYYTANRSVPVQCMAIQGLLVKHTVKNYLLHPSRMQMFTTLCLSINTAIEKEESQIDWIPLECYYDQQF